MDKLDAGDWTWILHSSLLIAAIYCRFARIWSVRNLDLLLLLALTPTLAIDPASAMSWVIYALSSVLVLRLVFDCRFVRRPRVEPNLSVHGLSFLCCAAYIVLMINAFTQEPDVRIAKQGNQFLNRIDTGETDANEANGPTTTLLGAGAQALSENLTVKPRQERAAVDFLAARIVTVIAHTAIVSGLLLVGYLHFGGFGAGLAMATLYLLLPFTAFHVHQVTHALPAAFLIWAFVFYKRPMASGAFLGLACGTMFCTVFLLPLWSVFYGRKRFPRFAIGLAISAAVLTWPLAFTSSDPNSLGHKVLASMNWSAFQALSPSEIDPTHISDLLRPLFLAVFACVFIALTIWPRSKNLSHLIAHSTVLVVLAQLWYPETTGIYVLWYLPLLLLVVFRPRVREPVSEEQTSSEGDLTRVKPAHQAGAPAPPAVRTTLYR